MSNEPLTLPPPTAEPPARRRRRGRRVAAAVGLALLATLAGLVFSVGFGRDPSVVRSVLIDKPAPPLRGRTLTGAPLDLRSYRGDVVLVNVWASWCAACRAEQAVLNAAAAVYRADGLRVVGIDMDDTLLDARAFVREYRVGYPSEWDPQAQAAIAWGTFGVPETYVVDRAGTIRQKAVGALTPGWIRQHVLLLLGAP